MPFIGNTPDVNFTSFAKQDLTGVTGSPAKTGFTLTHAVANANEIEVFVNNVRQEPTEAYTVNGTGLTMTGDVETTDDFYIIYLGKALQTTVPPDGSVSTAKIADSAVSTAKISDGSVSTAKLADGAVSTAKIASSAVDLTSKVTGVLPVANGGTGVSSGFSYEEGTWTPVVENGWGILNPTYSTNVGYYTKIGNLVHVTFKIVLNGGSTNSNQLLINVLPFASNQPISNSGVYQTLQGSFSNSAGNAENVFFKVGNINTTRAQSFRRTATGETSFTGDDAGTSFNCTFSGTYRTDL
jgi:hypothetical protein